MGVLCSRLDPEGDEKPHPKPETVAQPHLRTVAETTKRLITGREPEKDMRHSRKAKDHARADMESAKRLIDVLDVDIDILNGEDANDGLRHLPHLSQTITAGFQSADAYFAARQEVVERERTLDFDFRCRKTSPALERRAERIIAYLKRRDAAEIYAREPPREGFRGQRHERFAGDHFLTNVDLINRTALMEIARKMPKGAHLHIHFNACLLPNVLLDIAKDMDRMFITSDLPLVPDNNFKNFDCCEIQFSLKSKDAENPGDLFSPSYTGRQTMRFKEFLARFPQQYGGVAAEDWLMNKLVFCDEEAHNSSQTASGAWEKFNGRTRMMKGLFNYETAYRKYTRLCLEDFMKDNIQYAEIRPNFMMSNQLYHDDGTGPIDNWGIMNIIIEEVNKFKADVAAQGKWFGGLKVIYCTPRSFGPEQVQGALAECIEFKKRWPEWIAGFDLVGEEAKGRPIKDFIPQLLQFQQDCRAAQVEIPFLFHCGETLDMGTDTDGNLVDALLLNSKRIGHGFALAKHPYIMQQMKARNVCLELCPISNEILGLTPRVSGHAMYQLMANNVHCTVSSDNGTLFRSSLSHDFYQVMVGKADMGLTGWKQLILWSIEHSCLSSEEREELKHQWDGRWYVFLQHVVDTYGPEAEKAMAAERAAP